MPCLSFLSELSSSSGRTASTPLAGFPWRKVVVGGRSGDSSSNKLVGRLDLARLEVIAPSVLGRRGGGREQQGGFGSSLFRSVDASETGFRRWIRSSSGCSVMCIFSAASCSGLGCSTADCSSRRAALFLPAMMPIGRQFQLRPSVRFFSFPVMVERRQDPLPKWSSPRCGAILAWW